MNKQKLFYAFLLSSVLMGCAATGAAPVDIPIDIAIEGTQGDVNTSITNSVHNIVSQLEVWQMGIIVGLAFLVGWLAPNPAVMITSFFSSLRMILKGFFGIFVEVVRGVISIFKGG